LNFTWKVTFTICTQIDCFLFYECLAFRFFFLWCSFILIWTLTCISYWYTSLRIINCCKSWKKWTMFNICDVIIFLKLHCRFLNMNIGRTVFLKKHCKNTHVSNQMYFFAYIGFTLTILHKSLLFNFYCTYFWLRFFDVFLFFFSMWISFT